jgi:serine/threonine protein kinase
MSAAKSIRAAGAEKFSKCSLPDVEDFFIPIQSLNDKYSADNIIGTGYFSKILLATDVDSSADSSSVVIKCIPKRTSSPKSVSNEILVGTTCISRNIARTIVWSEDTNFYYIVIEYIKGQNFLEIIEGNKGFFWKEPLIAIEIIINILKGLFVLHSHNFIHRDLKLENIMVSLGDSVKIIDFGFSVPVSQLKDEFSGTLNYIPPEAVSCFVRKNRSQKIDIWAIGVIIYLMLFGKFPYECASRVQLIEFMRDLQSGLKKMRFLKKLPESSDANIMILFEVMRQCFQINPEQRPSSEELLTILSSFIKNEDLFDK